MPVTAKLFQFGNSQAVFIPAQRRFEVVQDVEAVRHGDERVCAMLGVRLTAVHA